MRVVGSGTYGRVYEVDGMAYKVLKSCPPDDSFDFSMLSEVAAYQALAGAPNVARAKFDRGRCLGPRCHGCNSLRIIMPLRSGTLMDSRGDFKEAMVQLLRGMAAIHAQGIIHNDVKPYNILHHEGQYEYIDFGMARFIDFAGAGLVGARSTSSYEAPEQALLCRGSTKSDVFSLAVALIQWKGRIDILGLHAAPPHERAMRINNMSEEELKAALCGPPQARGALASLTFGTFCKDAVSPECEHLLNRMLSTDWDARPSASECLAYLTGEKFRPEAEAYEPIGKPPRFLAESVMHLLSAVARIPHSTLRSQDVRDLANMFPLAVDLAFRAVKLGIPSSAFLVVALSLATKLHLKARVPVVDLQEAVALSLSSQEISHWEYVLVKRLGLGIHCPEQDMYKGLGPFSTLAQALEAHFPN